MVKSRAVLLLKSLSKEDLRWFYKFIKSPYYNVNQHIIKLYGLLKKYYPDFDHPKVSSEQLFSKLFPKEPYDAQRMRLILHRFANLLESFLVAQEIKADDLLHKKTLVKSLARNNSYDLFEKKTNALLDEFMDSPIRDEEFFKNNIELNLGFHAHPTTNRQKSRAKKLLETMKNLDDYFELSKVKLACALKAIQQTVSSEDYEMKYLDMILKEETHSNILLQIYKKIIAFQESEEREEYFEDLREVFVNNIEKLGKEDKKNVLQILLNFCTRMVNRGISKYIYSSLDLHKIGLRHDCFLVNNNMSEASFINIVSTGVGSKEFEWTKFFIKEYGDFLDQKISQDAITFSQAILHFHQGEFKETIQLIGNYQFPKPLQMINSKAILTRTYVALYFENDSYYDLVISQLATFEKYIRNNKFTSDKASEGYLNFIKYTRRMVKLNYQGKDLSKLRKKINSAPIVLLKSWLLEKCDQS